MESFPLQKQTSSALTNAQKNDLERIWMKDKPCDSLVGSFMYAQVCTGPDLAFVVSVLGRF